VRTKVGLLTLNRAETFTQYSECAAWTDYVTCEPQSADLWFDGYWVFASFNGKLTSSSFPEKIEHRQKLVQSAHVQNQAFGGVDSWLAAGALLTVSITNPDYSLRQVSTYSDGRPMFAVQPATARVAAEVSRLVGEAKVTR
jgi:hypothetical protein